MRPTVSIIVPCYNEQDSIGRLLDAISAQTYPRERTEVLIADGMSQDGTRKAIAAFQQSHPDPVVRIVDNPERTIPSALNLAAGVAQGEFIIRLDAHSIPNANYVQKSVQDLESGKGTNVGGIWIIRPGGKGWIAAGIAAAAGHPLGAGDASYRLKANAGPVDTVPFGAFRRSVLDEVGKFDETLLTNEDYEFNTRIRRSGGVIWLDPEIKSEYVARANLTELARQYWRYGYWKLRMLLRYPDSIRWRQAIPPVFVLSLVVLVLLSFVWRQALLALATEVVIYVAALTVAGVSLAARARRILVGLGAELAMMTMHAAWGGGFLWSLVVKVVGGHG